MALVISLGVVAARTEYFSSGSHDASQGATEEVREPTEKEIPETTEGNPEPTEVRSTPPKGPRLGRPDRYLVALVGDSEAMDPMVKVVENVLAARKDSFRLAKPVKVVAIEPGSRKWNEVEEDPGLLAAIGDTYTEENWGIQFLPDSGRNLLSFDTCGFRAHSTDYGADRGSSLSWPDTSPFPLHASESVLARSLASYLEEVSGIRTVALITSSGTFGSKLRSALQEKGVRVNAISMGGFGKKANVARLGRRGHLSTSR
jgi:hypothetical protein